MTALLPPVLLDQMQLASWMACIHETDELLRSLRLAEPSEPSEPLAEEPLLVPEPSCTWAPQSCGCRSSEQSSKVFVGGLPSSLSSKQLFHLFQEYTGAAIKKAWVQKPTAAGQDCYPPPLNRGFGFVVFEDKQMVDLLIKPDARTFVPLSDGRQLEVKRALSAAALRPRHRA